MFELGVDAAVVEHDTAICHLLQLGNLQRIDQYGLALSGQLENQLIDLGLRAYVDALGGVVHQQDVCIGIQPAGKYHLLLVAAGKGRDQVALAVAADVQHAPHPVKSLHLPALVDQLPASGERVLGDEVVFKQCKSGSMEFSLRFAAIKPIR